MMTRTIAVLLVLSFTPALAQMRSDPVGGDTGAAPVAHRSAAPVAGAHRARTAKALAGQPSPEFKDPFEPRADMTPQQAAAPDRTPAP